MTFKDLTESIADREGLKDEVDIAQIKEITKILLTTLANQPFAEVAKLLGKYQVEKKQILRQAIFPPSF
jgi:hypothetical protein